MLYHSPNSESYQDFLSLVIALGFSSFRGGIVHFYHLGYLSKPARDGLGKNLVSLFLRLREEPVLHFGNFSKT